MQNKAENFINWTKLKIRIHFNKSNKQPYFKEREIWWASLGVNIGYEQDGKNNNFERPVLILKKFGPEILWVVPLTSKTKSHFLYYQFNYNHKNYSVILSQIRTISRKRLLRKIRTFPEKDFNQIKRKIENLL
ncbi:MAG: hypothetical protein COU31_01085 [Candidatus Magasanikbacteria bacterium CG10_big_fil_rev_8_21_14_0_10_40_10]|uniref:Toxin-antitoxin system protein n=1 Tax=Candidatus Magasanikbacteria bacterium CG10_big_fil_rev_8_21_14_0_10_40_10 TaxID=1974648 RepID=A0A2M6W4U1_9BACT|nr:MAG: hypothetical protein COU31_01085 [Candidatus Magasanikbacteria bacterium CG10_big_fil_rev_8_21_14_0_10_40_10]